MGGLHPQPRILQAAQVTVISSLPYLTFKKLPMVLKNT